MISISNVTARNFLSIGNQTQAVRLDQVGLTLVLGHNADVGGANARNGVGKSTLLQALSFGLYGEPLADIKLDNLINNINTKGMLVTVEFEVDGKCYRIERGRKPNVLRFFAIGDDASAEVDSAQGENKHTQAEIERLIGMSHLLFQHIVGMNTYTIPFLKLKPAQQREVIEELLGVTTLSKRDEALAAQMKSVRETIRDEEAAIKAATEANARIETAIARAEIERTAWNQRHQQTLRDLQDEACGCDAVNFPGELDAFDALEAWVQKERELRAAAEHERREADMLTRELERLNGTYDRTERERSASSDSEITRRERDARRLREQAADTSQSNAAKRLLAEAERAEREAERDVPPAEARLLAEVNRLTMATQAKQNEVENRLQECGHVLDDMRHAEEGHCATCGQGLAGTKHLADMQGALAAKAERAQTELERCKAEKLALERQCDGVLADIAQLHIEHSKVRAEWRERAASARAEVETERRNDEVRRSEMLAEADALDAEIVVMRDALLVRQASLQAQLDAIVEEMQVIAVAAEAKQTASEQIAAGIADLGPRPSTAFKTRDEVVRLREACAGVKRDLDRELARVNPNDAHVASLQATLSVIDTTVRDEAQTTLRHQDFLHKLLSGKDSFVRKRIIDANLLYLNGQMNSYLDRLGLPHEVKFQPDLSVEISLMGRDFDFAQLSRGEMNRVMLACSWSFRDVWEALNTTMNLLFVDEMADTGLDESGAEAALDILNTIARRKAVFLISHKETLMGRAKRILLVRKENQFTRFDSEADADALS